MAVVAAVTAVVAVAGAVRAQQARKAELDELERRNELLISHALEQYRDIADQERFVLRETSRTGIALQVRTKQAEAQVTLAANAASLGGASVDNLLQDIELNEGLNIGALLDNQEQELDNLYNEAKAIRAGAIAGTRVIRRPSSGSKALELVSAGASGFAQGQSLQNSIDQNTFARTAVLKRRKLVTRSSKPKPLFRNF